MRISLKSSLEGGGDTSRYFDGLFRSTDNNTKHFDAHGGSAFCSAHPLHFAETDSIKHAVAVERDLVYRMFATIFSPVTLINHYCRRSTAYSFPQTCSLIDSNVRASTLFTARHEEHWIYVNLRPPYNVTS
eukprot:CFRG2943T1